MRVRKWIEIVNMIETRFKKISIKLKAGRILLILIEIAICGTYKKRGSKISNQHYGIT